MARTLKNLGLLSLAQILARLAGLIVTALIARHLAKSGFGDYNLCLSFAAMFGVLAGMGVRQIVLREIAGNPDSGSRYLSTAICMAVPQALLMILVVFATATIIGYQGEKLQGIMVMSVTVSLISYESLFYSIFEARERMHFEALAVLFRQALWVGLALFLISRQGTYLMLLRAMLLVSTLNVILSGILVHRFFYRIPFVFDTKIAMNLWKAGIPLAAAAVLVDIYMRIDVLMVDRILGSVAVGLFAAGMRILESLKFISSSFFIVIYPLFSRLSSEGSHAKLQEAHSQSLRFISMLLVPMAAGLSALASPLISLIFDKEYAGGALAFSVLVWILAILGISVVMGRLLVAMRLQRVVFWVSMITVAVKVGINFIFIPWLGIVGAGITSVLAQLLVATLNWYFLGSKIQRPNLIKLLWRIYVAAGLMWWLVWGMQRYLNLWQLVPLGVLSYSVFLLTLGGFEARDRVILRQLFQELRARRKNA